jgi:hypothetical protein
MYRLKEGFIDSGDWPSLIEVITPAHGYLYQRRQWDKYAVEEPCSM